MFELTSIHIESWLASLSSDQLNDLAKSIDKHEAVGLSDVAIKTYGNFVIEMGRLKVIWQTIISKVILETKGHFYIFLET